MAWALTPLTEEQRAIQSTAREFAKRELAPFADEWDENAHFEPTIITKLAELGFLGMMVPERYDGLGLDTLTYLVALEEIAAVDASTAVLMSVHNSLPTQMLLRWGTEEQKSRFLKPMARGELLGAFALSEPDSGSDAASLRMQATRDGDCWVLNGTKAWVSSGTHAGVVMTMARTDTPEDRKGARGIGAFIITPDLPGYIVGKKEDKMGLRASPTVQLHFESLRVPKQNLLGEPGLGFIYAMQSLDAGRLGIAAQAVGIAQGALDVATKYARERKQFGQRIGEFQMIQAMLADMDARTEAARQLTYKACTEIEAGSRDTSRWSALCKLVAGDAAMRVTTDAVQVLGGYGYIDEFPVERMMRDAKITQLYEGTQQIQRLVVARALLDRD